MVYILDFSNWWKKCIKSWKKTTTKKKKQVKVSLKIYKKLYIKHDLKYLTGKHKDSYIKASEKETYIYLSKSKV